MKHKGEIPKDPKELNPAVMDDLSGVILKCVDKSLGKRYASAAELRESLRSSSVFRKDAASGLPEGADAQSQPAGLKGNYFRSIQVELIRFHTIFSGLSID